MGGGDLRQTRGSTGRVDREGAAAALPPIFRRPFGHEGIVKFLTIIILSNKKLQPVSQTGCFPKSPKCGPAPPLAGGLPASR